MLHRLKMKNIQRKIGIGILLVFLTLQLFVLFGALENEQNRTRENPKIVAEKIIECTDECQIRVRLIKKNTYQEK